MTLKHEYLKEGDILHCTSDRLLSKIIRYFTNSNINHSALVIKISGETFIVDSQAKGTYPISLENWNKKYKYKYIIARPKYFTDDQKLKVINKFGVTPYDYMSLIYQAIYQTTGKWIGKTKNEADDRLYCSEFVSLIYKIDKWWKMSPGDLYEYTLKNKFFKIIDYGITTTK